MAMIVGHLTSTVVVLTAESMIEEASLTGNFISGHYFSWKENVDLLSKSGQNLGIFLQERALLFCSICWICSHSLHVFIRGTVD
jgi:hypothetical protein